MEARFLKGALEEQLGKRVFLDSDDLRDLGDLLDHVRDSEAVVLLQSQSVLTRPWCLLELAAAMDAGVPVVGVSLQNHAGTSRGGSNGHPPRRHAGDGKCPRRATSPTARLQSAPLRAARARRRRRGGGRAGVLDHGVDLTTPRGA